MDLVDSVIEESKRNRTTYINGKLEFVKRRFPPHLCTSPQGYLVDELVIYNIILHSGDLVHIAQVVDGVNNQ